MSFSFHSTIMGKRFYEGTMPRIAHALDRIASALEHPKLSDDNHEAACNLAESLVEQLSKGNFREAESLIKRLNSLG